MSRNSFIAELRNVTNIETGEQETLYFSTGKVRPFPPDDPDRPNQVYQDFIKDPANFELYIFSEGRTSGESRSAAGILSLNNAKGQLDYLINYAFDGSEIYIYKGENSPRYFSGYTQFLVGLLQQPVFNYSKTIPGTVDIIFRDLQQLMERPIQRNTYPRETTISGGVVIDNDEILDDVIPLCYGENYEVPAVLIDKDKLIYQFGEGESESVGSALDGGLDLPIETGLGTNGDFDNYTDFRNATVTGGYHITCLKESLVRLGSTPNKDITVMVYGALSKPDFMLVSDDGELEQIDDVDFDYEIIGDDLGGDYLATVPEIIYAIQKDKMRIQDERINIASYTEAAADFPAPVGIFIKDSMNAIEAQNLLCQSGDFFNVPNRFGQYTMGRFKEPSETPDYYIGADDILDLQKLPTSDFDKGIPPWKVIVYYKKIWLVRSSGELGGALEVDFDYKAFATKEYRTAIATDPDVLLRYPNAPTLERYTLLTNVADATAFANELLVRYSVRRDRYKVTVRGLDLYDVNDTINMTLNRFALENGKNFRTTGVVLLPKENKTLLDIWG